MLFWLKPKVTVSFSNLIRVVTICDKKDSFESFSAAGFYTRFARTINFVNECTILGASILDNNGDLFTIRTAVRIKRVCNS